MRRPDEYWTDLTEKARMANYEEEEIMKLEWRTWQNKFDIYMKGSTQVSRPTEALGQTSL